MQNGLTNGHTPHADADLGPQRFSGVPSQLEIPIASGEAEETVELDLSDLQPDPTELCTLLENENVPSRIWITISLAYAKEGAIDTAIALIQRGLDASGRRQANEKLALYNALCWYYLYQSRNAPRMRLESSADGETKTKDTWLRAATSVLNDASRINPTYAPLHLAKGVLSLLRAALISDQTEKTDALKNALKSFDDSLRASNQQNMMAIIGRARANYSMAKYAEALKGYQQALERAPDLSDPDPRIGIGCCFWSLGHHEDAKVAWERALEVNPDSKIANVLLGIQTLEKTSKMSVDHKDFQNLYRTAIVKYVQAAFKLDSNLPLACTTFGTYFLRNRSYDQAEKLAKKAVEATDVSSIASDAWYLLARKEHYGEDPAKAADYYTRADLARGGDRGGYLPAKLGGAQIQIMQGNLEGARFRLERIVQHTKNVEAMTLLATLWAEDAFTGRAGNTKEELLMAQKKAIPLLENVRTAWKDPKRNLPADTSVLLNLARLYEAESPEKALSCLQQVELIELGDVSDDVIPEEAVDEDSRLAAKREHLPPQLLNNIACFHYQSERYSEAIALFQAALNGCIRLGSQDPPVDTNALVASLSFNLGRSYEAENNLDDAKRTYEQLLERNPGYLDARMRLVNIGLRQSPIDQGPQLMKELYEADSQNLDVRALYGWFLRKAKRRTNELAQDQEQRHYKHSLSSIDKHDRYSLTAMGNMHLTLAREMRRETEGDREKRSKMYAKSVEFFEKALQLDPRNAYAAQGIGISLVEDKKDYTAGLQIFSKVKDTIKDASVFVNLGHTYIEVKQYARAIEAYEAALLKSPTTDPQILACLGRAHLLRGKAERSILSMRASLEHSKAALAAAPTQIHFKFNVAFVQIQIAQLVHGLPETGRTLEEIDAATTGLDEAISAFEDMAKRKDAPFPKQELEQRASMGKNTMKRQLERAAASQREYEGKNAERLAKARQAREAEIQARAEERRLAEEKGEERKKLIREERERMAKRDRELADARREEERRKVEDVSGEEGEKKARRKGGKRKKKGEVADSEGEASDGPGVVSRSESERPRSKKKRKLDRGEGGTGGKKNKFKSDEFIVDDDELDDAPGDVTGEITPVKDADLEGSARGGTPMDEAEDQPEPEDVASTTATTTPRKKSNRVIDEDDEDDDADDAPSAANGLSAGLTQTNGEED